MKIKRPKELGKKSLYCGISIQSGYPYYCSLGWLGKDVLGLSDEELQEIHEKDRYNYLYVALEDMLDIPIVDLEEILEENDLAETSEQRIVYLDKYLKNFGHQLTGEES